MKDALTTPTVPTTDTRRALHEQYCRDGACYLTRDVREQVGTQCTKFDELLLDVQMEAVRAARHSLAGSLLDLHMDAVLQHGVDVGKGLAMTLPLVDGCNGCDYVRRGN